MAATTMEPHSWTRDQLGLTLPPFGAFITALLLDLGLNSSLGAIWSAELCVLAERCSCPEQDAQADDHYSWRLGSTREWRRLENVALFAR